MLQKGLSHGIVAMECVCLVEGGWKTLFSLLSRRFVQLGLLRRGKCHLRSLPVVPLLRNMAGKEVLGVLHQQRHGLKMGAGDGVPHRASKAICGCLELALNSFPESQKSHLGKRGRFPGEQGVGDKGW